MSKLISVLLSFCAASCFANDIKVALINIPDVLEHDKPQLPYSKLLTELRKKIKIEGVFLPSSRANKLLDSGKLDCIFPILPTNRLSSTTIISEPINGIKAYAFSVDGKLYKTIESLKGKTVVYLRGYLFGGLLRENSDIHFFPVTSQQSALGVLKKGRADAYVDYLPDLFFALKKHELTLLNFDINSPLLTQNDVIECVKNEKTMRFLGEVNKVLTSLKESNKLKEVLGEYYVETN